jgi:serine/threonine protein kinase
MNWEAIDQFAQYHPLWFESARRYTPSPEHLNVFNELAPTTWRLHRRDISYLAEPPHLTRPDQGWKIHISARTDDTVPVLCRALPILLAAEVSFKFIADRRLTSQINGKLWPRGSSGKFITIYPADLSQFHALGNALAAALIDFAGPYVLSDKRWPGSKSVFYRYGGFRRNVKRHLDGTYNLTITAPEGRRVLDLRTPFWSLPEWVTDPFPAATETSDPAVGLNNGRFLVTGAISFSNRGGVYTGVDTLTGTDVVIKEARQHVEIGQRRVEATQTLEKEHRLLDRLSDTGYFVRPIAFFREWEHAFLVQEYVAGDHLGRYSIGTHPLYSGRLSRESLVTYFRQMRRLWSDIAKAIAAAHERRIVLADLSFTNVLLTPDHKIRICDLEASFEEGRDAQVGLYTPGFIGSDAFTSGVSGKLDDYHSLGAIMMGSIMLINGAVGFYPDARPRFLAELRADLDLPTPLLSLIDDLMDGHVARYHSVADAINRLPFESEDQSFSRPRLASKPSAADLLGDRENLRGQARDTVAGIIRYIHAVADTSREDRLFPADLSVFETNPLSVAHGAAGVAYAVQTITKNVPGSYIDWISARPLSDETYPPGLYVGYSGVAWALRELGQTDRAVDLLRRAGRHELVWSGVDIMHGCAGYGMACLKFWMTGLGETFLTEAVHAGEIIMSTCKSDSRGLFWLNSDGNVPIGYGYGGSGVALFLLYLHLATGNASFLQGGRRALDFDLAAATRTDGIISGFPHVVAADARLSRERVSLPYWNAGTAGVMTTLFRYCALDSDERLSACVRSISPDLIRKYTVFPQLFRGLAGLGNALLDGWLFTKERDFLAAAWRVAEGVLLFRIDRPTGLSFPGEQSRRESTDYATGSSGVALFLNRLLLSDSAGAGNFNFVLDELFESHGRETSRISP